MKNFLKDFWQRQSQNQIAVAIVIASLILGVSLIAFALINKNKNLPRTSNEMLSTILNEDKIYSGLKFNDKEYILGNTTNKITVLVYSDFECPYCKRLQEETIQKLQKNYKLKDDLSQGKIGIVYRHFAQSYHKKTPMEVNAAFCTRELYGQNSYINFINRLYEMTPTNDGLDLATLPDISKYSVELAMLNKEKITKDFQNTEFNECLNKQTYNSEYLQTYQDAINVGLEGTPYSLIIYNDGQQNIILSKISGLREASYFEKIIDQLLKIK